MERAIEDQVDHRKSRVRVAFLLLLRVLALGALLLVMGFVYGTLHLAVLLSTPRRDRARVIARLRGRVLRTALPLMGPTFIKIGQVASARSDLFSKPLLAELVKLQHAVPPFSFRRARRAIAAALGSPLEARFRQIEEAPVASGSVAQVHRAVLTDGAVVAVKVLRPRIHQRIERDGILLNAAARLLSSLSSRLRAADLAGSIKIFLRAVRDQVDLRREARNYEIFAKNFADQPQVRFPRVFHELCGPDVLTMEFIEGKRLDQLEPEQAAHIGPLFHRTWLQMIFEHGFVHADLHPGNLVATDAGELVIYDVGLVAELSQEHFDQLFEFYICMGAGTVEMWLPHLQKFHGYLVERGTNLEEVAASLVRWTDLFRSTSIGELKMSKVSETLADLLREHHMRAFSETATVVVGMTTSEGITKMLLPDAKLEQELMSFIQPLAMKRGLLPGSAADATANRPADGNDSSSSTLGA